MKYRIVQKSGRHFSVQVQLMRGANWQWHQIEVARTMPEAQEVLDTREILAKPGTVVEEREIPAYSYEAVPESEPLNGAERYRPVAAASNG